MSKRDDHHQLQSSFGNAHYTLGEHVESGEMDRFPIGRMATELRDAWLSSQHYDPDLTWLVAMIYFFASIAGWGLALYGMIRVHVWIWYLSVIFTITFCLAVVLVVSVRVKRLRGSSRYQEGLVYFFMAVAIFQLVIVLVWLPTLPTIYDQFPIFWWFMMIVLSIVAINGIGAVFALANWVARCNTMRGHCLVATGKVRPIIEQQQKQQQQDTSNVGFVGGELGMTSLLLENKEEPEFRVARGLYEFHSILSATHS